MKDRVQRTWEITRALDQANLELEVVQQDIHTGGVPVMFVMFILAVGVAVSILLSYLAGDWR